MELTYHCFSIMISGTLNKVVLIESGHSHKLQLLINNKSYDATLFNFSKAESDKDTLHVRYNNKNLIFNKQIFSGAG